MRYISASLDDASGCLFKGSWPVNSDELRDKSGWQMYSSFIIHQHFSSSIHSSTFCHSFTFSLDHGSVAVIHILDKWPLYHRANTERPTTIHPQTLTDNLHTHLQRATRETLWKCKKYFLPLRCCVYTKPVSSVTILQSSLYAPPSKTQTTVLRVLGSTVDDVKKSIFTWGERESGGGSAS